MSQRWHKIVVCVGVLQSHVCEIMVYWITGTLPYEFSIHYKSLCKFIYFYLLNLCLIKDKQEIKQNNKSFDIHHRTTWLNLQILFTRQKIHGYHTTWRWTSPPSQMNYCRCNDKYEKQPFWIQLKFFFLCAKNRSSFTKHKSYTKAKCRCTT